MNEKRPAEVCHEDLWDHIDEVRERVMHQIWAIVGVFTIIGGSALAWGVSERASQIEANRIAAERYGAAAERQAILIERLDEIRGLLKDASDSLDAHSKDPYAHPSIKMNGAEITGK